MGHSVGCQNCGTRIRTNLIHHPADLILCEECEPKLTEALNAMIEPGFTRWLFAVARATGTRYFVQYRQSEARRWRILDHQAYWLEEALERIERERVKNPRFEYRTKLAFS